MAKRFVVGLSRTVTETVAIEVTARDKRDALLVASPLIEGAAWERVGSPIQRITGIEIVKPAELALSTTQMEAPSETVKTVEEPRRRKHG